MIAVIAANAVFNSGAEPFFASGCEVAVVFCDDVAQHVLFAQQPNWQAFSVATFERIHARAERDAGATMIVIASNNESVILPAIGSSS